MCVVGRHWFSLSLSQSGCNLSGNLATVDRQPTTARFFCHGEPPRTAHTGDHGLA
jgi:hypothetical protein